MKSFWLKKKIIFSITAIFLIFLVLETVFRVYDIISGNIIFPDLVAAFNNKKNDYSKPPYHPFLRYTQKPNFSGQIPFLEPGKLFEVNINSHGFRTREFYPKLPGYFRILLLGDSFIFGFNANQVETTPFILEQLFQKNISKKIKVLSLGMTSYSTLSYAALIRIFTDFLKPDLIIVAVDQSDFEEDLERYDYFLLDKEGAPIVLKDAYRFINENPGHNLMFDTELNVEEKKTWLLKLRAGSSFFNKFWNLNQFMKIDIYSSKVKGPEMLMKKLENVKLHLTVYGDLVKQYGTDLSKVLPVLLLDNMIPYDLDKAMSMYVPTFKSLKFIKTECAKKNIDLYFSSYPYPWMVSTSESIPYQFINFKGIYDFRKNRVHPQLMEKIALKLNVPHLNAYPIIENNSEKKYGNFDPHFNAKGYAIYAKFLYDSIKDDVRKKISEL